MRKRSIFRATFGLGLMALMLALVFSAHAFTDGYIKGAVTRGGQPVRGAWVSITQNGAERGSSPTGDDGRYYIGGLADGGYEVVVSHGNRPICRRTVNLPANNRYDIALPCN